MDPSKISQNPNPPYYWRRTDEDLLQMQLEEGCYIEPEETGYPSYGDICNIYISNGPP
jgi:hypothetical protein